MSALERYLGLGAQRKGANLPNIVLGWFEYWQDDKLRLAFKGKDCPSLEAALTEIKGLVKEGPPFCLFYSERGEGFYLKRRYEETFGAVQEKMGRLIAYPEEEPDPIDPGATRLAADVQRLRQVELDWPANQFTSVWKNLRSQLRSCELNDEPGRGPLKRLLQRTQKEVQTEWVPTAAMAFAAVRRAWAEYGTGEEEDDEGLFSAYEFPVHIRVTPKEREARPIELPDPLYAFAQDQGEFIDYELEL